MQDLFKRAVSISENKPQKLTTLIHSVSPAKAGRLFGTFTPSKTGSVKVRKKDGSVIDQSLTRRERRLLVRRMRNGQAD